MVRQQVATNHLSRVGGRTRSSRPRVYVMGYDFTGKTTVVMALSDATLNNTHKARPEHKADRDDATPGVHVSELALDKPPPLEESPPLIRRMLRKLLGEPKPEPTPPPKEVVGVWDFAGHSEYHVTHGMLLNGDGVHLVMCDLSCADEAVRSNMVMYWLRLIKCRFSTSKQQPHHGSASPPQSSFSSLSSSPLSASADNTTTTPPSTSPPPPESSSSRVPSPSSPSSHTNSGSSDSRPIVIVCGSNRDSVQDGKVARQVKEEDGTMRWASEWGDRLVKDARNLFKDHLNIAPDMIISLDMNGEKQQQQQQQQQQQPLMHVLDCRIGSLGSLETDLLRQTLASCRRMVVDRVGEVPRICEWVIKAMPQIRQSSPDPIVGVDTFRRLVVDCTDFSSFVETLPEEGRKGKITEAAVAPIITSLIQYVRVFLRDYVPRF